MRELRKLLSQYDCIVLTNSDNTFYASGVKSSNCYVVLTKSNDFFITDNRYALEATKALPSNYEVVVTTDDIDSTLEKTLSSPDVKTIGLDEEIVYSQYVKLIKTLSRFKITGVASDIFAARMVKLEVELDKIREAQSLACLALEEIIPFIKLNVTERELAVRLEFIMKRRGAESEAFETIVAFGENSSKPHARPTFRRLKIDEPVLIDFGAKVNGYCSDMTRTMFYGTPSSRFSTIYEAVLEANLAAIDEAVANRISSQVDKAARDVLYRHQLGQYFTHGTGHGVGVAIHELPMLSQRCDIVLKNNMVVTVEPGVYIENEFGIRIEDLLIINNGKPEILTKNDKQLISIH